jgi:hypothetical protein
MSEISFDDLIPNKKDSFNDLVPKKEEQGIVRQLGLTARAALEGFASPATAVLEAGRGVYNIGANLLGSESRIPSFAKAQSEMLTRAGVPEPQNTLERVVQAGTQGMASTAGLAAIAPAIAKALPATAQAFGEAAPTAMLTENMARQIPAAAAAGSAGQGTFEGMKSMGSSDISATLAAVGIGALAAGIGGQVGGAALEGKGPRLYTMDEIKQRSARSYQSVDDAGITVKPQSALGLVSNIRKALDDANMIPGSTEALSIEKTLAQMENIIGTQRVPFSTVDRLRQMASQLKISSDPKEARLGAVAVDTVDNYITKLNGRDLIAGKAGIDDAVKKIMSARKDWRNASRAEVLNDALDVSTIKAELGVRGSEAEFLRQGIARLATNKDKMALFSKEEQNILKSVAAGGPLDPLLTGAASFSPLRSKLSAAGEAYTFASNPELAATVAGGGLAADALQNYLKRQAAQEAVKRIASGETAPTAPNMAYRGLLTGGMVPPTDLELIERQPTRIELNGMAR